MFTIAEIGASTRMSPGWVPPGWSGPEGFDVVTVTEVPAANALLIVLTLSVELLTGGLQVAGGEQGMLPSPLTISMLESGSSNQTPDVPLGAAALTEAKDPTTNWPLPEVSMVPPSPPAGPP